MHQTSHITLSICISTFNRASFIGVTLDSIISQATSDCEIVVVDGASTDHTNEVVEERSGQFERLRYFRQNTNNGVDRDFDHAVELAYGKYCWLFSDDDVLKPGAIAAILKAIHHGYSLILVNGEHRDFSMRNVRVSNFFGTVSDKIYGSDDMDLLFADVGTCLICICCVVIKRSIWIARERIPYFGSRFVHVGVILQEPLPGETLVLATPSMCLRLGNDQTHNPESFHVWYVAWPSLIWSLALATSTKRNFCTVEPWRRLKYLLALRAKRRYSHEEYRRWVRPHLRSFKELLIPVIVIHIPCELAYVLYVIYCSVTRMPRSPDDAFWTMFPKSLKALQ